MKIPPWLGHLRRDRRGLPVPYINNWGPEDPDRYYIAPDPHIEGCLAIHMREAGQTVPDFTRQNPQRQRECMVRGLCQVCGRPIPWSERFLVLAAMSVKTVHVTGLGDRPVIAEPWLDAECAAFAVEKCPDLIRRARDERLSLVTITAQQQTSLVMSRGWVEGRLEEISRRVQPVFWVKVILNHIDIEVRNEVPA